MFLENISGYRVNASLTHIDRELKEGSPKHTHLSRIRPNQTMKPTRAVESSNFKRLRLRLRLHPENFDSDSNSDSASTPAYHEASILKRAISCSLFIDFPFHCVQTGDMVMQHPHALTADALTTATGRGYR